MLVAINFTGPTSRGRSKRQSNQQTINFYPEKTGSGFVLHPFPGLKAFSTGSGFGRGIFEHRGVLYQVDGPQLYTIDSTGARTARGAISGTSQCIFEGIGEDVVISTNSLRWFYDTSLTTLTQITDADLEAGDSCAHLNNTMIYDGLGGRFVVSDVGDATSIDPLNYATAESNADNLLRVYTYDQIAYMLGELSTETWYFSGQGQPPLDRIEGGIIPVGLGALHSVDSNDNFMYLLSCDKNVYQIKGTSHRNITTPAIAHELEQLSITDAIGSCYTFEAQNFYEFTIPLQKTFVYSESTDLWFNLSSEQNTTRYLASGHAFVFGKNYVEDYRNGNIYELDLDTYDEFGDAVVRIRDSAPLSGELFGAPGKEITLNRLEVLMEVGVGAASGEGFDPEITVSISNNGGRTFNTERWGKLGQAGQFLIPVEWSDLGSFVYGVIRLTVSDPILCSIHSAAADIEIGI